MSAEHFLQGMDPRTGEPVGTPIPVSSDDDLEATLSRAEDAAAQFAVAPPVARSRLLDTLADRVDADTERLVDLALAETGLPRPRLTGEVERTTSQLRLFADVIRDGAYLDVTIDRGRPDLTVPRPDLRLWMEPLGPVLVFAASNFPFAFSVIGGDTASALAAGCPVVVKVHDSHPGLAREVITLAETVVSDIGLPAGVFGAVYGERPGIDALRDPRIRAAGFTGSTTGGMHLLDVARSRPGSPIPFYGELGSVNPTIVTPGAVAIRGDVIVDEFIASMTLGTGQFCTKPGLLFLPTGHGLLEALGRAIQIVEPAPMLNARICQQFEVKVDELAGMPEVERLGGSSASPSPDGAWVTASLYRTTTAVLRRAPEALAVERFGPTSLVVEYSDLDELLATLAVLEGSLTATVQGEVDRDIELGFDIKAVLAVLRRLAGRVIYNGWPTGVAVTWAMHHGGPWPATTLPEYTSVGPHAIRRWLRPVCYQSMPATLLPSPLTDENPWCLPRRRDGRLEPAYCTP